jgi:hypothetical protein
VGGGVEVLVVDPDGHTMVLTNNPLVVLDGDVDNEHDPGVDTMGYAYLIVDLEPIFGGPLPPGYTLMFYVKFQTAMKHQSWPTLPVGTYPEYTHYFYNQAYLYFDDDTDYFADDLLMGYPPLSYTNVTGAGIYLTEN